MILAQATITLISSPLYSRLTSTKLYLALKLLPQQVWKDIKLWCQDRISLKRCNFTHLRALLYTRLQRIPKSILLCSFNAPANKLIINRLFHKNPRSCYAALSLVIEQTNMGKFHSSIHCKEMQSASDHKPESSHHNFFINLCHPSNFPSQHFLFLWPFKTQIYNHLFMSQLPFSRASRYTQLNTHSDILWKCRFNIFCPVRSVKKSIQTES